eukprot:3884320-Prymnesium_polylepis.1
MLDDAIRNATGLLAMQAMAASERDSEDEDEDEEAEAAAATEVEAATDKGAEAPQARLSLDAILEREEAR